MLLSLFSGAATSFFFDRLEIASGERVSSQYEWYPTSAFSDNFLPRSGGHLMAN